jgi:hypothetical protein
MFYLWRRIEEEDRRHLWRLYGWFAGLIACGSCFGAVAWSAKMMNIVNYFKGSDKQTLVQQTLKSSLLSAAYGWLPVFYVPYAIEFMCLCAAKLMVLDRMLVFAVPEDVGLQKRWAAAGRIVMAVVVLGNAVGLAANIAASTIYQNAADAYRTASAYYAANNTNAGDDFFHNITKQERQKAGSSSSVQYFSEVAVLLIAIISFVVVGAMFMRRLSASMRIFDAVTQRESLSMTRRLQINDAAATGRALWRRMLGTTGFIFFTFLLRCVFTTMHAVAYMFRDVSKSCPSNSKPLEISRCSSCYNSYAHIVGWVINTPEFELMIVMISSPVTLLVALWGMTTPSMLQLMHLSERDSNKNTVLLQSKAEGDHRACSANNDDESVG